MNTAEVRTQERWRELVQMTALRMMRVPFSQRPQPVSFVEGGIQTRWMPIHEAGKWMEELGDPRLSIVQRGRAGSELGQITLVVLTRPLVETTQPAGEPQEPEQGVSLGQITFLLELGRWFLDRVTGPFARDFLPPAVISGSFFEETLVHPSDDQALAMAVPFNLLRFCSGHLLFFFQAKSDRLPTSRVEMLNAVSA